MPNGGYPGHMVLRPRRETGHIVECRFTTLRVMPEPASAGSRDPVLPALELDADEVDVLVEFLTRWLREKGHHRDGRVNAFYDF